MTDRDEEMWALAYELAKTGDYANSPHIEGQLRLKGFRNVDEIARNPQAREEITRMCFAARKAKSDATRS